MRKVSKKFTFNRYFIFIYHFHGLVIVLEKENYDENSKHFIFSFQFWSHWNKLINTLKGWKTQITVETHKKLKSTIFHKHTLIWKVGSFLFFFSMALFGTDFYRFRRKAVPFDSSDPGLHNTISSHSNYLHFLLSNLCVFMSVKVTIHRQLWMIIRLRKLIV